MASTQRRDKKGSPYWTITVMDETGSLEGRVWSNGVWKDVRDGGRRLDEDRLPERDGIHSTRPNHQGLGRDHGLI